MDIDLGALKQAIDADAELTSLASEHHFATIADRLNSRIVDGGLTTAEALFGRGVRVHFSQVVEAMGAHGMDRD